MGPWPLFYYHISFSSGTKCGISFMDVVQKNLKYWTKCENLIRDITPRVVGPWPLFYYHTSFSSGTKCGIQHHGCSPEIFKVLNKMCENLIRDITLRFMGPWPLFNNHILFSWGTKCGISSMEVGPQTFKLLNKMWSKELQNFEMTEGHGKSNIAPLFQSGATKIYH